MESKESNKNKRPVPNTEERIFLRSQNCNERIYVYLLLKSKRRPDGSENHRYLEKIPNKKIAEDLGISRNTVGKRMQDLISLNYIIKEGKYYLVPKTDYYTLIQPETLDFLLNYLEYKKEIIKLYIILLDYFNLKKTFTMVDLHIALGYSLQDGKPSSVNSKYIRTLLMLLSEAGLIKYEIREGRNSKGAPCDQYCLLLVRSKIDDKYIDSYQRLKKSGEITEHWEKVNNFFD